MPWILAAMPERVPERVVAAKVGYSDFYSRALPCKDFTFGERGK